MFFLSIIVSAKWYVTGRALKICFSLMSMSVSILIQMWIIFWMTMKLLTQISEGFTFRFLSAQKYPLSRRVSPRDGISKMDSASVSLNLFLRSDGEERDIDLARSIRRDCFCSRLAFRLWYNFRQIVRLVFDFLLRIVRKKDCSDRFSNDLCILWLSLFKWLDIIYCRQTTSYCRLFVTL